MKKVLFSAIITSAALSGFSQGGTVSFQNNVTTSIFYAPDIFPTPTKVASGNLPGGGPLVVGLFWGTTAASVNTLVATAEIGSFAGQFNGNDPHLIGGVSIPGTNPNDVDWFSVIAWDSSFGTTVAGEQACLAAGGFWGSATGNPNLYGVVGTPLQFTLGATEGPGNLLFDTPSTPGFFQAFDVNVAPEPSTIGLGCLGATALLLLCRRKNWMRSGRLEPAMRPFAIQSKSEQLMK
jgi:hypothetical protein